MLILHVSSFLTLSTIPTRARHIYAASCIFPQPGIENQGGAAGTRQQKRLLGENPLNSIKQPVQSSH